MDSHTCTEISVDINQTRYCICSEPWKFLSLQRQLQKLWSLLKEKKEKKENKNLKLSKLQKEDLEDFWEAMGSTASVGFSSERTECSPQHCATFMWQWVVPRPYKPVFHGISTVDLLWKKGCKCSMLRNLYCSLFSEGFSTSQLQILSRHV